MKKRKLKAFVLPSLYVIVMGVLFISIAFLGATLEEDTKFGQMAVSAIKDITVPVVGTNEATITKPFSSDKVVVSKSYYDMHDEETKQQQSLVYYENTYLQNSGVLYSSDEVFEVLSVMEGTVTKVSQDDILGNVVEISHNNNLKTVYYSLNNVTVKENEQVSGSTVIGESGDNSLENEKENCLLFEVYYNGEALDPEEFYTMNLNELQ